jgi:hypothetical protein|nr:MAG TPA: hypothetical protein [Caudoviricetes sp.]
MNEKILRIFLQIFKYIISILLDMPYFCRSNRGLLPLKRINAYKSVCKCFPR